MDVVETINLIMSSKGSVLRADVDGQILMRAYLSGTPECKFGLNDKLVLDRKAAQGSSSSSDRRKSTLPSIGGADESTAVELDGLPISPVCQAQQV